MHTIFVKKTPKKPIVIISEKKGGGSLQLINIVAFINNPPKNVSVLILLVYIKTFPDDYQLLFDFTLTL